MLFHDNVILLTVAAIVAVLMDALIGEFRRFHPLVGFGSLASKLEQQLNHPQETNTNIQLMRGAFATSLLLFFPVFILYQFNDYTGISVVINIVILYFCIGLKSLQQHAEKVIRALLDNNHQQARFHASMMVSRDPAEMNITRSTTESVLENGNDAVFAALFWFLVAGAPGAVLYRLSNTLDAMWGYRNDRFCYFGRFAARLDDVLNYLPARLTAVTYALLGHTLSALRCWKLQAGQWDSPNAGVVMAAGAGALQVRLGGSASYHGIVHSRAELGAGNEPSAVDIHRALLLVRTGTGLWLLLMVLSAGLVHHA